MKIPTGITQAEALAWLASTHDICYADLYQFDLPDGTTWRFTSADFDLSAGGYTYRSSGVVIKRGGFNTGLGVRVQSLDLTITPDREDSTLAGFVAALDYSTMRGSRVTWSGWFGDTWQAPVFTMLEFSGRVTGVDDDVQTTVNCMSDLVLLDTRMPRNVYQSDCLNELYDSQCQVLKASYQQSATVAAGSTRQVIKLTGPTSADGHFDRGGVAFTGALSGIIGSIRSHTYSGGVTTLVLVVPIESAPTAGMAVTVWPGCDKAQGTCVAKFNNVVHFRGHPYIPMPETAA